MKLPNSPRSKVTEYRLPCPHCPSSDGYHKYDDGHGYCFSCTAFDPPFGLVDLSQEFTYEFLPWRGLNKETLKKFNILTKVDHEGKPISVGYTYADGNTKVRSLAEKAFKWVDKDGNPGADTSKSGLFGQDKFPPGSHKYVTITEGELDAASFWQVIKSPVVSVSSASSAGRDCAVSRSYLNSYERIYLAFDNDAAGREALRHVAKLFDFNKVYVVKFGQLKDANEFLQAGMTSELYNLWTNSRKYLPEVIVNTNAEFKRILLEPTKPGIPYPLQTLNAMTFGIRKGETVLVTAQEGVGKTELMHTFEYGILKRTDANVGAIYLEEPKRRHLQAIAGIELQRPVHLPNCGVSDREILAALEKAIGRDERLHVYSHFGSDDPDIILDTIRFLVTACGVEYLLFDHVSMAVSGLAGEDERRALDYLCTRLEVMVKELDFALILVSHVNDFGQTRGSRYIGKICDIRIDLKRDLTNPDIAERYTTYLTVAKNRFASMTGPAGKLRFDPVKYILEEVIDETPAVNDNFMGMRNVA